MGIISDALHIVQYLQAARCVDAGATKNETMGGKYVEADY